MPVARASVRRAIVVLIFAATIGVMLLKFPGPLFQEAAKTSGSPKFTEMLPMDADNPATLELHQRAQAAMAALESQKSPHE